MSCTLGTLPHIIISLTADHDCADLIYLFLGFPDKLREKMDQFILGDNPSIMLENKEFLGDKEEPGDMKVAYCFVYLGRNSDNTAYACLYVYYTAEIRFTPKPTISGSPFLWGLLQPTENEEYFREFFKYKALEGLLQNGVIKKINFVQ